LLAAIENQCFGIPITYLFDFIIGTSIGGHIALSLASTETPFKVGDLKAEFSQLMHTGIKPRLSPIESSVVNAMLLVLFNLTTHRNDPMERALKHFFGSERRVLAVTGPPGPLVAVTTVSMDDLSVAQIIPN
jgi:patatin-like phospholipase/acyl hydrolase